MDQDQLTALSPSPVASTSCEGGAAPVAAGALRTASTRRAAVRSLAGCALAAGATRRAPAAGAIKGWCRRDPIVTIGGRTVQIGLSSEAAMHELATGPTQLVITVPVGAATRFLADDPGFGHYGYDVRFTESRELRADGDAIEVQLAAYAPADPAQGPLPLVLEFTPRGGDKPVVSRATGRANEWVHLRANLTARDDAGPDDPPADGPDAKPRKNVGRGRRKKQNP